MERNEVKLKINDTELRGVYANQVGIMHTGEEFVIDFIAMLPPEAVVTSRIVMTPAAMKRMYNAIGMNIAKYEENFGEIVTDEISRDGTKIN